MWQFFFGGLRRKYNVELRDAFPAQPVEGIKYSGKKTDSPSAAAMKWSDVKHSCNPLRKHSSFVAPQITIPFFNVLLEVPSDQQKRYTLQSTKRGRVLLQSVQKSAQQTVLNIFSKSNRLVSLHRLQRPN